ncbi:MAG: DUF4347 domain-containing protein [Magnetospirillum sp.]|nr:DUF4347 domain-containing protein [Magnetospirillum sp.]
MLDAAVVPSAVEGAAATRAADPAPRTEVMVVFSDVANWQDIAAAAPAGTKVSVVSATGDGLKSIAAALEGQSGIDAVHIVGHGEAGTLMLGDTALDAGAVASHAADLAAIGAALSADADLLFYGCESGQGGSGAMLAAALSQATGADVALSDDPTGAAARGGDWVLETRAGTVETAALAASEWDGLLQTTATIDVPTGGTTDGAAGTVAISQDGRYVAFTSSATNLVAGDTNGVSDVFRRDTQTGTTIRVSVGAAGAQADGASTVSDMSTDGRYVVFASTATNLVAGDTNAASDVFVHDTQSGTTIRVSVNQAGGTQINGASTGGSISGDGSKVAFVSAVNGIAGADANNRADVFVRKLSGGPPSTTLIGSGDGASSAAVISNDGSTVAFVSTSTDLVAGDTNGVADVFTANSGGGAATRISVATGGTQGSGASDGPSLSDNGRMVAFATTSPLVSEDTNGGSDIYARNVDSGTTILVSRTTGGAAGNGASTQASISGGGDYVAFTSTASDLVNSDGNGVGDVFVRNLTAGETYLTSADSSAAEGNAASDNPALSSDGGQVAFRSLATNLAGSDGNALSDVFLASGFTVTPADLGLGGLNVSQHPGTPGAFVGTAPSPVGSPDGSPPPPPPPGMVMATATAMTIGETAHAFQPTSGTADAGRVAGADDLSPRLPPGERLAMLGREGLSMADRRMLLHGMGPGTIIEHLRASGEPAARVVATLMEAVQNGETVDLATVKEALAAEGVSDEVARGYIQALAHVDKATRTERLSGALSELAVDGTAADAFKTATGTPRQDIAITGNKVALLIGVQTYGGGLPALKTPDADVTAMSAVLAERFGYQTIVAKDAGKAEIVDLIRSVGERLDGSGSLIVYYAGHGYAVESSGEGYWLPAGARTDSAAGWISTRDLSGYLGQVKAGQIMVVSDSCYSGALTKEMRLTSDAIGEPREQILTRRSVTALSSGGDEPVADGGGNGHSVFAGKLLGVLNGTGADAMGFQVFAQVRNDVVQAVPQEPTYGGLTAAGHAGGTDFVIGGR